jgi:UDPglucose 6-dehydrogenase
MVERNVQAQCLCFTTSYAQGLDNAEFVFIAVNTPAKTKQGMVDMRYLEAVAHSIAEELDHYAIIINKGALQSNFQSGGNYEDTSYWSRWLYWLSSL